MVGFPTERPPGHKHRPQPSQLGRKDRTGVRVTDGGADVTAARRRGRHGRHGGTGAAAGAVPGRAGRGLHRRLRLPLRADPRAVREGGHPAGPQGAAPQREGAVGADAGFPHAAVAQPPPGAGHGAGHGAAVPPGDPGVLWSAGLRFHAGFAGLRRAQDVLPVAVPGGTGLPLLPVGQPAAGSWLPGRAGGPPAPAEVGVVPGLETPRRRHLLGRALAPLPPHVRLGRRQTHEPLPHLVGAHSADVPLREPVHPDAGRVAGAPAARVAAEAQRGGHLRHRGGRARALLRAPAPPAPLRLLLPGAAAGAHHPHGQLQLLQRADHRAGLLPAGRGARGALAGPAPPAPRLRVAPQPGLGAGHAAGAQHLRPAALLDRALLRPGGQLGQEAAGLQSGLHLPRVHDVAAHGDAAAGGGGLPVAVLGDPGGHVPLRLRAGMLLEALGHPAVGHHGHGHRQPVRRQPGALHLHRPRVQREAVARDPPDVRGRGALPGGELLRALPQDDRRRRPARGHPGGQLRRAQLDGDRVHVQAWQRERGAGRGGPAPAPPGLAAVVRRPRAPPEQPLVQCAGAAPAAGTARRDPPGADGRVAVPVPGPPAHLPAGAALQVLVHSPRRGRPGPRAVVAAAARAGVLPVRVPGGPRAGVPAQPARPQGQAPAAAPRGRRAAAAAGLPAPPVPALLGPRRALVPVPGGRHRGAAAGAGPAGAAPRPPQSPPGARRAERRAGRAAGAGRRRGAALRGRGAARGPARRQEEEVAPTAPPETGGGPRVGGRRSMEPGPGVPVGQCLQHGVAVAGGRPPGLGDCLGTPPHSSETAWGPLPRAWGLLGDPSPVSRDSWGPLPTARGLLGDPSPQLGDCLRTPSQCPGTFWGPCPNVWGSLPPAQGPPGWGAQHRSMVRSGRGLCAHGLEQFGQCQPHGYPAQPLRSLWGPPRHFGVLPPRPHPALPPRPGSALSTEVSYNFLIKAFDIPAPQLSWNWGWGSCAPSCPGGQCRMG